MREIMISINPQWVEKILNHTKTIEIRKTKPKCELPCKVYIYCTQGKRKLVEVLRKGEIKWFGKDDNDRYEENTFITIPHYDYGDKRHNMLGKVVAEFTLKYCDKRSIKGLLHSMVDFNTFAKNCGLNNFDYENNIPFITNYAKNKDYIYAWYITDLKIYDKPRDVKNFGINKPPQSWCYVEKVGK